MLWYHLVQCLNPLEPGCFCMKLQMIWLRDELIWSTVVCQYIDCIFLYKVSCFQMQKINNMVLFLLHRCQSIHSFRLVATVMPWGRTFNCSKFTWHASWRETLSTTARRWQLISSVVFTVNASLTWISWLVLDPSVISVTRGAYLNWCGLGVNRQLLLYSIWYSAWIPLQIFCTCILFSFSFGLQKRWMSLFSHSFCCRDCSVDSLSPRTHETYFWWLKL